MEEFAPGEIGGGTALVHEVDGQATTNESRRESIIHVVDLTKPVKAWLTGPVSRITG